MFVGSGRAACRSQTRITPSAFLVSHLAARRSRIFRFSGTRPCQTPYSFISCGSILSGHASRSKFQSNRAMIRRMFRYAKLRARQSAHLGNIRAGENTYLIPTHFLGPIENGAQMCRLSDSNSGSPSHRSGMNSSGRRQYLGDL